MDVLSSPLLELIPDAVVIVDAAGVIRQINSLTEQLFGYNREELVGQKLEVLVPERYRSRHVHHREGFEGEPKVRRMGSGLDLFGRRNDGSEFPVEISLSPLQLAEGFVTLSVIRDITDQKKIQAELRRAHDELSHRTNRELWEYRTRLISVIDSSEDAIITKDLDGIITSWNAGATNIYGYSAAEAMGKPITLLVPKDRHKEVTDILDSVRRGERVEHYESIRIAKDGRVLNMSLSISPVRASNGEIVGASVIARDVTEQKRTEEQLRQSQKMEAIGRLAGGVAHDFNNVLGIISACNDLLRARIERGDERWQYLDNMHKAAERGANLTRQLLAFSRKQIVRPQVFDLNQRLHDTSRLVRPLMGDDVEVLIRAQAASSLIEADPGQVDQVLLNLSVNARDAMPQGGKLILETATVEFDADIAKQHAPLSPGKHVMLAVSDTGIGMDQVTVSRMFEPFFTTKEVGKGTGLGLATVYGIVKQCGGHIWVYSEPGRGTTLKIYFPSADAKLGLETAAEAEADPSPGNGATVLLVEDDELMSRLTRQMLEEHGYEVLEAPDAKTAMEFAEAAGDRIRVVLTDVVLRGMSGPEMVRQLIAKRPNLAVVYMSGYTGELISEHDLLHPGVKLLEKPFSRLALLRRLAAALE